MFGKGCCQSWKFLRKKQSLKILTQILAESPPVWQKQLFAQRKHRFPNFCPAKPATVPDSPNSAEKFAWLVAGTIPELAFFFFFLLWLSQLLGRKWVSGVFFGPAFRFFCYSNMKAKGCNSFLSSCSFVVEKLDFFFCEEDDIFELYQSEFFFVVMHTIRKKVECFWFWI